MEQVGVPQLANMLQVPIDEVLLWPVYTDFDISEESQSNKKKSGRCKY
jgi:hypothetical protein